MSVDNCNFFSDQRGHWINLSSFLAEISQFLGVPILPQGHVAVTVRKSTVQTYVTFFLACLFAKVLPIQWIAQSQIHGLFSRWTSLTWFQCNTSSDRDCSPPFHRKRYCSEPLKSWKYLGFIALIDGLFPRFKEVSCLRPSNALSFISSNAHLSSPSVCKFFIDPKALSLRVCSEFKSMSSSVSWATLVTAVGILFRPHCLISMVFNWELEAKTLSGSLSPRFSDNSSFSR